jgi:hypothetical protein
MLLESVCIRIHRNNGVYKSVRGPDEGSGCIEREKKREGERKKEREEGKGSKRECQD